MAVVVVVEVGGGASWIPDVQTTYFAMCLDGAMVFNDGGTALLADHRSMLVAHNPVL